MKVDWLDKAKGSWRWEPLALVTKVGGGHGSVGNILAYNSCIIDLDRAHANSYNNSQSSKVSTGFGIALNNTTWNDSPLYIIECHSPSAVGEL